MPQESSNRSGPAYRVNPVRPEGGAQAQHIVVPAASVVPAPEGVSLAQASILLMTGLTALNALEIAALKKGQILAVSGGAGLLAQYAIAAAKRQGIKVIADANPADAELVRSDRADRLWIPIPDASVGLRQPFHRQTVSLARGLNLKRNTTQARLTTRHRGKVHGLGFPGRVVVNLRRSDAGAAGHCDHGTNLGALA
jgi:threonine dehydrogenase-like Zn-dependent dehydrogenase